MKSPDLKSWFFRLLELIGITTGAPEFDANEDQFDTGSEISAADKPDEDSETDRNEEIEVTEIAESSENPLPQAATTVPKNAKSLLAKIEKYASYNDKEGRHMLQKNISLFEEAYPELSERLENALARGKYRKMWKQIRWDAMRTWEDDQDALERSTAAFLAEYPGKEKEVQKAMEEGRYRRALKDIQFYAGWGSPDGKRKLQEITKAFKAAYPERIAELQDAIKEGQDFYDLRKCVSEAAFVYGKDSEQVRTILKKSPRLRKSEQREIEKVLNASEARRQRGKIAKQTKKLPHKPIRPRKVQKPGADGLMIHASNPQCQKPSPKWTIVIDESGEEFGPDANRVDPKKQGRFVAVAIPGESPKLPPLKTSWHAAECIDVREIDAVLQDLLNADAAILGVTMSAVPEVPGQRWADGVTLLIDWLLRLLPIDGPTEIEVLVENRGLFERDTSWPLVERECLRRLAAGFARTAAWIDLKIHVIGKSDSPYNGYVDAVANTWVGGSKESRRRLRESELVGSCLLEIDSHQLLRVWNSFAQGTRLSGSDWWQLLPHATKSTSLVAAFLNQVGIECRENAVHWTTYLNETRRQMATGTVDLRSLADASEWLTKFQPADGDIPPLLRLSWLTVKLARSNHYGETESSWEQELSALAPTLVDEAAPLVCQADLHLAVARTNRFDFDGATRALERWEKWPLQVPGLLYWAQVRSSLGQHEAFRGNYRTAVEFFDQAIDAFLKLSDVTERNRNFAQTATYRAIAMMDGPAHSDAQVRAAVEQVTGPLDTQIKRLARSTDETERYAHHLALRWLVRRGAPELVRSYLDGRSQWFVGYGHPWPLIQLYRGILLHPSDPRAALTFVRAGAELALAADQGPIVQLIGLTCQVIAEHWDPTFARSAEETLVGVAAALPAASPQIEHLKNAINHPLPPVGLLERVLPFNFH